MVDWLSDNGWLKPIGQDWRIGQFRHPERRRSRGICRAYIWPLPTQQMWG